jgi:hypothetical protein
MCTSNFRVQSSQRKEAMSSSQVGIKKWAELPCRASSLIAPLVLPLASVQEDHFCS